MHFFDFFGETYHKMMGENDDYTLNHIQKDAFDELLTSSLAEVARLHDGCAGGWPCISQGAVSRVRVVMSQKS